MTLTLGYSKASDGPEVSNAFGPEPAHREFVVFLPGLVEEWLRRCARQATAPARGDESQSSWHRCLLFDQGLKCASGSAGPFGTYA